MSDISTPLTSVGAVTPDSSPTTVTPGQPIILEICHNGDLILVLDQLGGCYHFIVSMQQLSEASTYFDFTSDHKRCSPSSRKLPQLVLSGSFDPITLAVVLYGLHGRREKIPMNISFSDLVEVAEVVNTFSCAPAMRPWDYIWMEQWRHHAEEAVFEAWLFVAWVFEDNDIFQRLTRKFTRIGVMKDEEFVIDINTPFHKDLPHVLLENMREARSTAMLDVIKEMRDLYDKYEAGICTGKKIPCTCYETETGKCNAITFAGLHAGFKNIEKRGPLALTLCFNAYQAMSLEVLAQNISSIKWTPLADRSYYTCTPIPQLAKAVNGHIENIKPLDLSWDGYNDRTSRRVEVKWHDIFSTEFSY